MKSCMLIVAAALLYLAPSAYSQDVTWDLVRPSNTGIPGEEVRTVKYGPDGRIWVGARWPFWGEGGIGIFDPASDIWTTYSNAETGQGPGPIPSEFVNDIEFAADGTVWIATGGGAVHFDGANWAVYNSANTPMAFDNVWNISIAPDGHVWINNSHFNYGGDAIWEFDGVNWIGYRVGQEIPFADPWDDLADVFAASNGDIWVTNDTLPGVARRHNGVWTLVAENIGVFGDIAEDSHGNIWIAPSFDSATMAKFDGNQFSTYNVGLYVLSLSTDIEGAVYYGNWNGFVERSYDGGATWQTFLSGLNQVYSIAPSADANEFWIGTIGALGQFSDAGQWIKDYNSANTGQPDYFLDMLHLGKFSGNFFVATGEYGVSRFEGNRWVNRGSHNPNVNWPVLADGAWGVYEDRFGDVWIGTNGVARWSVEDDFDLWDWRNTNWGVTDFVDFAEDAAGNLFAFSKYGGAHRFQPQTQTWTQEPIQMYAVLGIPGAEADSQGNIYFGGWFDVARWDGSTWTLLELPYRDFLFDSGGASDLDVAPDDTLWIGCSDGLVHYDGVDWTVYDASNTPMSVSSVSGVDVRSDGVIGLALSDLGDRENCAAAIVDGDINDPASWHVYRYGSSPLPHPQLGDVAFDSNGALWVSAISEAAAVIHYPVHEPPVTELISMDVGTGALLGGDVSDLVQSDDSYVHTQSGFGRTLVDLHHMELSVAAVTTVASPSTLDLAIESRIDQPAGTMQVRLRNWNTGELDLIGSAAIGDTDGVDEFLGIDAINYVNAQGEIEASIKHLVFVPFLAFQFESFIDQVAINIR